MPPALVDVVAVVALAVLLLVAFLHPRGWVEVLVGGLTAGVVLATGAVSISGALEQVRLLLPVVLFLAGILVVAELCALEGVFAAVGALVARASRGSPRRMLALTFVAASLTTAALSLDATVVLLTPVVAAAASSTVTSPRPVVHACVRLANSASLLLPVSNLTNLLAVPAIPSVSFLGFAALMAPVWLAVIGVEYAGHRMFFRRELRQPVSPGQTQEVLALPVVPLVVVALMLVAFAALSPLGVQPAWVACAAAVVLSGYGLSRRRVRLWHVLESAHLPFGFFVLCLGVVVAGLTDSFLGALVRSVLPHGTGLASLLGVAVLATVLANLLNNLPATLLLVPLVAPLGVTAVLAALVGLGVGSGLTYPGSLANLLWRRTLVRRGAPASARTFHSLSALVTAPALVVGVVVLWAWAPVLR
ncbi:MAG: arsenical pump rane protein [Nocardioidaceae bacterium]|nr:arsenical pump rane protein [Nocardioidaceae bacterium]